MLDKEKCKLTSEELDSLFQILKEKLGEDDYLTSEYAEIAFKRYFESIVWHVRDLKSKEQLYEAVKRVVSEIDLVTYKLLTDALRFDMDMAFKQKIAVKYPYNPEENEAMNREAKCLFD